MDSGDTALVARSRRDLGGAQFTHVARSFSTTGAASAFPWSRERKEVPLAIQVRIAADPVAGLRWLKSSEQHG
jgi:hypothetical protein